MRRELSLSAVAALALTLTACAPDTSEAYTNCYNVFSMPAQWEDNGLTLDESVDIMVAAAELCSGLAEADPEAFIEEWGN